MKEKKIPLNAEQMSLILGISEFTVKKLARAGQLPCKYAKGRPYFHIGEVLKKFGQLEGGAA